MNKLVYILIFLIFPTSNYANAKINLDNYINSFSWKKRIVLFISHKTNIKLITEIDQFFKKNICKNEDRNLKYIKIIGHEIDKYNVSDRYKNKYGLWLIGYDSQVKLYSKDTTLLKKIYNVIDSMPVRRDEIRKKHDEIAKCN